MEYLHMDSIRDNLQHILLNIAGKNSAQRRLEVVKLFGLNIINSEAKHIKSRAGEVAFVMYKGKRCIKIGLGCNYNRVYNTIIVEDPSWVEHEVKL